MFDENLFGAILIFQLLRMRGIKQKPFLFLFLFLFLFRFLSRFGVYSSRVFFNFIIIFFSPLSVLSRRKIKEIIIIGNWFYFYFFNFCFWKKMGFDLDESTEKQIPI